MKTVIKSEPLRIIHWDVTIENYKQEVIVDYKLKTDNISVEETNYTGIRFTMILKLSSKKGLWLSCIAEVKFIIMEAIQLLTLNQFKIMIEAAHQLLEDHLHEIFLEDHLEFSVVLPTPPESRVVELFEDVRRW